MAIFLKVVGENIYPKDFVKKYNIKQPSRKVFNSDWIKIDEYQHEIANHFRDYQNRKKLNSSYKRRRRRRRHPLKVVFEEQPCVYRDILPLNRIDFPESNTSVYHKLFENCYGDTLRKIATIDSLSELRYLTKRQERLYKHKKVPSLTQRPSNQCSNNLNSSLNRRYLSKTGKLNLKHITSTDRNCTPFKHNHYVNGIDTNKVIREGVSAKKCIKEKDFSDDSDNCFYRLASECYDEGFLSHIEYLQSIVHRNAIKNTKNKRNNTENSKPSTSSQPSSAVSSVSSSSSCSLEELPNKICVGRFASAVNRLIRNPFFKQNLHSNTNQRDLKICVNLTRSTSLESLNSNRSSGQKREDLTSANCCIMSDFLNLAEAVVSSGIVNNNNSSSTNSTVKQHHFHDLIENLNRLEISDSGSLPKITISSADDDVKSSLFGSESNERTFLKQDSLEIDIPFFNDYYSSEARPP